VRTYFYANPPPGSRIAQLRAESAGKTVLATNAVGADAAAGTLQ
jgi:hypothetical protein